MKNLIFLLCSLLLMSCKNESKKDTSSSDKQQSLPALNLATSIERAHHKEDFLAQDAISFDLLININKQEQFDAKITMLTNSNKIKVEKKDGKVFLFDGEVLLSPKNKNDDEVQMEMLRWIYFFTLPYRLTNPDNIWKEKNKMKLDNTLYDTAKLTMANNNGDATTENSYVIYADRNTSFMKAAANIRNLGSVEANDNTYAIVYERYFTVKSIPLAKYWKFYKWNKSQGIYDDPIGNAEISELKYFEANAATFQNPKTNKLK